MPKPKLKKSKPFQSQIDDLTNKWKRALADYQNLEKRFEKEKEDFVKFYNASLLDKLLAVLDDLERAEKHLKDKGLTLTVNQFKSVLKTEGVGEIKSDEEEFDPEKMDCAELAKGPKNIVVETTLKGYMLNSRVLRPAKVKVGKG
jgi:molecular chaperone GrpE